VNDSTPASVVSAAQRWQRVYDCRDTYSDTINRVASTQSSLLQARVRAVSSFFKKDGSFESAIVRPDVIAFAEPLLASIEHDRVSDQHFESAAHSGLNCLYAQPSAVQRFFQLMIYPAVLGITGFAMYLGFAFFVAPEFEEMFSEFGIELPGITRSLLISAKFVRQFGWLIAAILVTFTLMSVLWRLKPNVFVPRLKLLENIFSNDRLRMANLALHAAQLRNMGLSSEQARTAAVHAFDTDPIHATELSRNHVTQNQAGNTIMLQSSEFSLLHLAIHQPANPTWNRMLFEVADSYRRRILTRSDWWVQWLALTFQWAIMAFVGLLAVSIFMPLISIIGGLTGA
jgi:type II secretory pathway component PulF